MIFDPKVPPRSRAGLIARNTLSLAWIAAQEQAEQQRRRAERQEQATRMQAVDRQRLGVELGGETPMSVRWIGQEDAPQPTQEQRAEQERDAAEREVARRRVEQQVREADIREQELRRLRAGARTQRQDAAIERVAYLDGLSKGRWVPHAEEWASRGSVMDDGRALRAVDAAAKEAVAEALKPLIAEAEAELSAATAEREEIIAHGHP